LFLDGVQWAMYIVEYGKNQSYEKRITAVIFTLFLPVARSINWTNSKLTELIALKVLINTYLG
jgi:hypothetical protein